MQQYAVINNNTIPFKYNGELLFIMIIFIVMLEMQPQRNEFNLLDIRF